MKIKLLTACMLCFLITSCVDKELYFTLISTKPFNKQNFSLNRPIQPKLMDLSIIPAPPGATVMEHSLELLHVGCNADMIKNATLTFVGSELSIAKVTTIGDPINTFGHAGLAVPVGAQPYVETNTQVEVEVHVKTSSSTRSGVRPSYKIIEH